MATLLLVLKRGVRLIEKGISLTSSPAVFPQHVAQGKSLRNFSLACKCQQSYKFGQSIKELQSRTVGNLLTEAANEAGDTVAIVVKQDNIRKTFTEFHQEVNKLAAGLIALGIKKGDRVGMWGPNCYEWILTQYATAKAGAIMVTINPAYRAKELEYALNKVGCNTLITSSQFKTQDYYELLCEVSPDLRNSTTTEPNLTRFPHLKRIVMISDLPKPGTITFKNVMDADDSGCYHTLEKMEKEIQFDDPVNIQFTSGTTGHPKGAILSHFNIVNNAYFNGNRFGFHEQIPVMCMQMPLYHCSGCVLGSTCSVLFKGTLVLPAPSFQAKPTLEAIQSEKCTLLSGTPTMFFDILNNSDLKNYDLSSLKIAIMGGDICSVPLLQDVKTKLGIEDIRIVYGCTETSPSCTGTARNDPEEKKLQTVGLPLDYIEVKVVDNEGLLVANNEKGEICLRGHATFLGYWDDETKTKEVLKSDKWYYTGDIGIMDESGYLKIVGRKKDMIIRGGENIYPQEIEKFLLTHPSVADVQVVGVPDKKMGEEICAWIRLASGKTMTETDVKDFCKNKISHFKVPLYILFVDDFPKTVTAKVQKFRMKEESIKLLKLENH